MRNPSEIWGITAVAAAALAIGIASYALSRPDASGRRDASGTIASWNVESLAQIDPQRICYAQSAEFATGFQLVVGLAVGPENQVYVAGDEAVRVFDAQGQVSQTIPVTGPPSCVAVGDSRHIAPGRIYVGVGPWIERYESSGQRLGPWRVSSSETQITSIAAAASEVFVADAAQRQVLRFNVDGVLTGKIGAAEGASQPFSVPGPFFDVAVGEDDGVHVVNPGRLRIETFSAKGYPESLWGQAGARLEDFFGCCNPAHFAVLPDGSFVTSEKGVPRVKVYRATGELDCVVAGPTQLGVAPSEIGDPRTDRGRKAFDVATDTRGRVLVLDPTTRNVRVFTRVTPAPGADS